MHDGDASYATHDDGRTEDQHLPAKLRRVEGILRTYARAAPVTVEEMRRAVRERAALKIRRQPAKR